MSPADSPTPVKSTFNLGLANILDTENPTRPHATEYVSKATAHESFLSKFVMCI
jgi:hypothetical protein